MFSNLGNIFTVKPRHAENTDTRLGIRRHDPEYERKKKKQKDEKESDPFDDDNPVISVESLELFLNNFLTSMEHEKAESGQFSENKETLFESDPQRNRAKPAAGPLAQAAGAYQSTAMAADKSAKANAATALQSKAMGLEAQDIRKIHLLLEDLKLLKKKKIEYLTIERSDSFLNSLIHAVELAKP